MQWPNQWLWRMLRVRSHAGCPQSLLCAWLVAVSPKTLCLLASLGLLFLLYSGPQDVWGGGVTLCVEGMASMVGGWPHYRNACLCRWRTGRFRRMLSTRIHPERLWTVWWSAERDFVCHRPVLPLRRRGCGWALLRSRGRRRRLRCVLSRGAPLGEGVRSPPFAHVTHVALLQPWPANSLPRSPFVFSQAVAAVPQIGIRRSVCNSAPIAWCSTCLGRSVRWKRRVWYS